MDKGTIGSRLNAALGPEKPAEFARRAGVTEATVSNWLNDKVHPAHVKAEQLFRLADAAQIDARYLLTGKGDSVVAGSASQDLKWDLLNIAFQLVGVDLVKQGIELPPSKREEAAKIAYELLEEGMPRAKVLRFVLAMAA